MNMLQKTKLGNIINIITDAPSIEHSKVFLDINKKDGKYKILTAMAFDSTFTNKVIELLGKHGDVFAAYVDAIEFLSTRKEKIQKVYSFDVDIESLQVEVVEVYANREKHDWKSHPVTVGCGDFLIDPETTACLYLGYVYMFKKKYLEGQV